MSKFFIYLLHRPNDHLAHLLPEHTHNALIVDVRERCFEHDVSDGEQSNDNTQQILSIRKLDRLCVKYVFLRTECPI